jgi:actin related protein 2/3 complex subunit 3
LNYRFIVLFTDCTDQFRAYFKQARDELGVRLMNMLFNADGTKNKWWQAFSKRRFMGKELNDK